MPLSLAPARFPRYGGTTCQLAVLGAKPRQIPFYQFHNLPQ